MSLCRRLEQNINALDDHSQLYFRKLVNAGGGSYWLASYHIPGILVLVFHLKSFPRDTSCGTVPGHPKAGIGPYS